MDGAREAAGTGRVRDAVPALRAARVRGLQCEAAYAVLAATRSNQGGRLNNALRRLRRAGMPDCWAGGHLDSGHAASSLQAAARELVADPYRVIVADGWLYIAVSASWWWLPNWVCVGGDVARVRIGPRHYVRWRDVLRRSLRHPDVACGHCGRPLRRWRSDYRRFYTTGGRWHLMRRLRSALPFDDSRTAEGNRIERQREDKLRAFLIRDPGYCSLWCMTVKERQLSREWARQDRQRKEWRHGREQVRAIRRFCRTGDREALFAAERGR